MDKIKLQKYAELLVKSGVNIQVGQELTVAAAIDQSELALLVVEEAYKAGAKKVRVEWGCDKLTKLHYNYQTVETLGTPEKWELEKLQHQVDVIPARLYIASQDPDGLKGVDQKKMAIARRMSYPIMKPYFDKLENRQQWCIAGAAGKEWAMKVFPGIPEEEAIEKLWDAIFKTARVTDDPVQEWVEHSARIHARCDFLNSLHLKELRYKSSNGTDFKVGLIDDCLWAGGSERTLGSNIEFNPNIPSEEVFTSPMKGVAEGLVVATKPLSYQGQLIENFSVRFEGGKVVEVKAEKNQALLEEMISMDKTACLLGECALIAHDSPINNTGILFFETLYDENASCHLALGAGFTNLIKDFDKYTLEELYAKGINDSMIHVDFMIGSEDMDIVGITSEGKEVQIFKKGNWAF